MIDPVRVIGRAPTRRWSLRGHLLVLVLVSLLPALAVGNLAAVDAVRSQRQAFEHGLLETASALALAVDAELYAVHAVLVGLADSYTLQPGRNLAGFHERRQAAVRALGVDFMVVGPGPGCEVLLDTRRPFGPPSPCPLLLDGIGSPIVQVFETGIPRPLQLTREASGGWITGMIVPVPSEGPVHAVLIGLVLPERLGALLAAQAPSSRGTATLIDAGGRVIARGRAMERFIGEPADAEARAGIVADAGASLFRGTSLEGEPMLVAAAPLQRAQGWWLAIGEPESEYRATERRLVVILVSGGAAAAAAGVLLAILHSRRLVRPVRALAENAAATAAEMPLPRDAAAFPDTRVREFAALRRSLAQAADLLERRRAEAVKAAAGIEREHAVLQGVLDGLPDAVWLKDGDGRYLAMNRAALALMGCSREAVPGPTEDASLPSEAREAATRRHAQVFGSGEGVRLEEDRRLPDGSLRRFATLTVPWVGATDAATRGTLEIARDVTEERRTEAELRRTEAALASLTRRASVAAVASGLAHELNQPLAAAANYLNAARRLLPPSAAGLPHHLAREALDAAAEQVLRAGEIIRRLRDFLAGKPPETRPEAVEPVLRESARLAMAAWPDVAAPPINVSVMPGLPEVPMDRVQIQQVLLNLLRNAMEATTQGQGQGGGQAGAVELAARLRHGAGVDWLDISVTDAGPGPPPDLDTRSLPVRTTKPGGMGLGLAICRDIAAAHGGRLSAGPGQAGRGVRMLLSLPLAPGTTEQRAVAET